MLVLAYAISQLDEMTEPFMDGGELVEWLGEHIVDEDGRMLGRYIRYIPAEYLAWDIEDWKVAGWKTAKPLPPDVLKKALLTYQLEMGLDTAMRAVRCFGRDSSGDCVEEFEEQLKELQVAIWQLRGIEPIPFG